MRVEGLDLDDTSEEIREFLSEMFEERGVKVLGGVDVAVDPITLRPSGHAYLHFESDHEAREAQDKLRKEKGIRVSLEAR
mmetsp:Transcript_167559/g.532739  ORF Transcript_167559/g.532739 Transcript_167559/m.532739 type:complete len:80 (+) Transcript_167559:2825-3064(+)